MKRLQPNSGSHHRTGHQGSCCLFHKQTVAELRGHPPDRKPVPVTSSRHPRQPGSKSIRKHPPSTHTQTRPVLPRPRPSKRCSGLFSCSPLNSNPKQMLMVLSPCDSVLNQEKIINKTKFMHGVPAAMVAEDSASWVFWFSNLCSWGKKDRKV